MQVEEQKSSKPATPEQQEQPPQDLDSVKPEEPDPVEPPILFTEPQKRETP